ncbi:MAG: S-adenosyl-methyltransferase MraW [uncultured bacterium]|uniref:Ribosomal RNA small subunit methyltransferase H n=1 Tax=Candidatus Woesebacteria bacterium RIFCSPHIGHO2_12_FULL_41_24 TaxID=1802510 RepID=A0A1F8AQ12_9BACT|nr:MAG: S-adenosyl-methyltransferase MraW [uncultured bacterium]OGM13246.1 MAG: 16S rRNA (cytosine(1402)-N(4))-methyltransferase [Candidatus Woesebacteria bacterium RBG_16_41_13]OGM30648.1 MAG: 16S rRNA (cytosine(1402)-N(4))-methyltransferase [Candidatus Woesebacteria bacterium RIFCSPHIGHO2_01_FULL_42_80]OGM35785.1 MAG: 16S rRNA (cytosine(1402)-N(4))-methyltransferase [Candidatus Woesebacteria bacterium RIFCSPHIGHO2_02_FULL_42_20]OGM53844.1 MAG: 16S rRNA (cytosine(1402)-N(4))-methyltransferase 
MVRKQKTDATHESVLVEEVISTFKLKIKRNQRIIDATVGTGGHTLELIKNGALVLGLEIDPKMSQIARFRLGEMPYKLILGNFKDIDSIAKKEGFTDIDGVLFDLGVSNLHLKDIKRGFSFDTPEALLDMRLNEQDQGVKAADLLNVLRKDQLTDLFGKVLGFRATKSLVDRIVEFRNGKRFTAVEDLLGVVGGVRTTGRNPATKAFLALRIAVNLETENIKEALPKAFALLRAGGRLCIISFHSLEDKIVKACFTSLVASKLAQSITKKPITPGYQELERNRRSRSAKMRVVEKI